MEINFYKNGEVVVFEAREAGTGQIEDYTWDGKYGTAPVVPEEPEAQAAEETSVTVSEYKWSNHPLIRGYIDDGILVPLDTGKFLVGSPAYRAVNLRPPNVKNQPKVLIGSIEMFGNMVQGYVKRFQVVGSVDEVARVVSEMERIFNGIPSLKVEEVDES